MAFKTREQVERDNLREEIQANLFKAYIANIDNSDVTKSIEASAQLEECLRLYGPFRFAGIYKVSLGTELGGPWIRIS